MADKISKRGLGTGLGALLGDISPLENELGGAKNVAIEKVEPRADQPRNLFDPKALEELASSIEKYGLIQPITVRKLDSDYYQIIAGERRWRAARLAGLHEVPIRIIEADNQRAMEMALVENLQREDLNPIEEAKGYRTLIQEYGMTQEETSESIGKSRSAIANTMRLLSLAPPVMAMVEDGDISAGHARALLAIHDETEQLRTATQVYEESLSVRQTEKLAAKVAEKLENPPEDVPPNQPEISIKINYVAETEKQLTTALGRKVAIKDRNKKGKIELVYYGIEDREALIESLLALSGSNGGI